MSTSNPPDPRVEYLRPELVWVSGLPDDAARASRTKGDEPAKREGPAFVPEPLDRPVAIISDIHANLEALQAVQRHIQQQGIERIVCLGDVVNYGPDPEACLDFVMLCEFTLMGNHEDAVLTEAVNFNEAATVSADWTRRRLAKGEGVRWSFMENLPLNHVEGVCYFVHASPREPLVEYILPPDMYFQRSVGLSIITENLNLVPGVCFVGHTHLPGVFLEDGTYLHPSEIGGPFVIDGEKKLIVNVGSVGQPRDQDPRACYAVFDGQTVEHHRVPYDVRRTMKKIADAGGLPAFNAVRLERGE